MAFRHGRLAEVTVNSVAMSTFCDDMSLGVDIDTADTTTFTDLWKTNIAGLAQGKVDLKGNYDPTVTTGPIQTMAALIGAAPFPVVLYPGGNSTGQISHTFNAILTNFSENSPVGGKVTFTLSLLTDGAITTAEIG